MSWFNIRAVTRGLERRRARSRLARTADRPHVWTLVLGLLGPVLSVVAVIVSLNAVWLNQRSMEIGQRAYVVIKNGHVNFRLGVQDSVNDPVVIQPYLSYTFDVVNLGRTPAKIQSVRVDIELIRGWRFRPDVPLGFESHHTVDGNSRVLNVRGDIGPDSTLPTGDVVFFALDDEAKKTLHPAFATPENSLMKLRGALKYRDVFDDGYDVQWCWVVSRQHERFIGYC